MARSPPRWSRSVISLDVNYDLTSWLTIGGKYAWRNGSVSLTRASHIFIDSAADLYVLSSDVHFGPDWDGLLEGRILETSLSHDSRKGFLAAVYRHLGQGLKLGVGYNFTNYSTDLTDQSYSTRGIFVNMLAVF